MLRNRYPKDTLSQIYTGIVEPHFSYYCPVFGGGAAGNQGGLHCKSYKIKLLEL